MSQSKPNAETALRSVELESVVLGCAVAAAFPQGLDLVVSLAQQDFTESRHQVILRAIKRLYERGVVPDYSTVAMECNLLAPGVVDVAYLAGLDTYLRDANQVGVFVERLRDLRVRRDLQSTCASVASGCMVPERLTEDLLGEVHAGLFSIERRQDMGDLSSLAESNEQVLREIREGKPRGLFWTGIQGMDGVMDGLARGELHIIAGQPGGGKSVACHNLALKARDEGVAVFSLEMSRKELSNRFLCTESGVNYNAIKHRRLNAFEQERVDQAARSQATAKIAVDGTPRIKVRDLISRVRRVKRERHPVRLVVVDYLQIMGFEQTGRERANRYEVVGENAAMLKDMAKTEDVTVIAAAQINRSSRRDAREPRLDDLQDSGQIEQHADGVYFLHSKAKTREERAKPHEVLFIGEKCRNGAPGTRRLMFTPAMMAFRDIAAGPVQETFT